MGAIKVCFEVTLAAESENGLDFKYYAPFSQKNWIKIEFPHKKLHFFRNPILWEDNGSTQKN